MPAPSFPPLRSLLRLGTCLLALSALGGCDQLGIETPDKVVARQEQEAKAIGSACRNGGRAIEDCYTLNPRFSRAAIYAGWREMDEYMRENKLEVVAPVVPRPAAKKTDEDEEEPPKPAASGKGASTAADKPASDAAGETSPAKSPAKNTRKARVAKPEVEIVEEAPSAAASRKRH